VTQIIRDHPWPAVGLAVGAGYLLSGSRVDVKASATTLAATMGASSRLGTVLDDLVANLMGGLSAAFEQRVEGLVTELKHAIGAPTGSNGSPSASRNLGTMGSQMAAGGAGSQAASNVTGAGTGGMGAGAGTSSGMGTAGGSFGGASGAAGSSMGAAGGQSRAD
jgi:hypothetical protein